MRTAWQSRLLPGERVKPCVWEDLSTPFFHICVYPKFSWSNCWQAWRSLLALWNIPLSMTPLIAPLCFYLNLYWLLDSITVSIKTRPGWGPTAWPCNGALYTCVFSGGTLVTGIVLYNPAWGRCKKDVWKIYWLVTLTMAATWVRGVAWSYDSKPFLGSLPAVSEQKHYGIITTRSWKRLVTTSFSLDSPQ